MQINEKKYHAEKIQKEELRLIHLVFLFVLHIV